MKRTQAVIQLRQILIRRRDALRRSLGGDLGLLRSLQTPTFGDVADAALDQSQGEVNSRLVDVESRELAQIEAALARMQEGRFGRCEDCGEGIPLPRLRAVPYAAYCVKCQAKQERPTLGGRLQAYAATGSED